MKIGLIDVDGHNNMNSKKDNKKLIYKRYIDIKTRCYNQKYKRFNDYGGRGIMMCDEWNRNFNNFYDWSINNGFSPELSIDRIDNNGNYCPSNCRWVDAKTQGNNRRTNIFISHNGETHTVAEWSDITGIPSNVIRKRYFVSGWDADRTLNESVHNKSVKEPETITYNGKTQTVLEWAKETGINRNTIRSRLRSGKSIEEALTIPVDNEKYWFSRRKRVSKKMML